MHPQYIYTYIFCVFVVVLFVLFEEKHETMWSSQQTQVCMLDVLHLYYTIHIRSLFRPRQRKLNSRKQRSFSQQNHFPARGFTSKQTSTLAPFTRSCVHNNANTATTSTTTTSLIIMMMITAAAAATTESCGGDNNDSHDEAVSGSHLL